jgi:hypothetical protein
MVSATDVDQAVQAWHDEAPDAAEQIIALPAHERRDALVRLGYDTPTHWEMFGL